MHDSEPRRRFTFLTKCLGAGALIGVANLLFYGESAGATLGGFALAWLAVLAATRPDLRRHSAARLALLAAAGFALAMVDDPGALDLWLFWIALTSASVLPQHRYTDAIGWCGKLALHALVGIVAPLRDLRRWMRAGRSGKGRTLAAVAGLLLLPVGGSVVFLALFASANPLIGNAFATIELPDLSSAILHLLFWSAVLLLVWPSLRPRFQMIRIEPSSETNGHSFGVPVATATLSLVAFNAIFAIENLLDLAFLWSGAPLPEEVTMADYAHRGAYPLIATALLAGVFVLVAAIPGTPAAHSRTVRRLIVLWVGQNLLLVASSILRTLDYVAAYSWTVLRLEALAWMALVGVGLVLIVWRMLAGRSIQWLINANALAAGAVLVAASVLDLSATTASWNVRHARTARDLDLCYLEELGASALLPLIELERRAGGPVLRDRAAYLRSQAMYRVETDQADWHSWTWRNARRLTAARGLLGDTPPRARDVYQGRACGGAPRPPDPDLVAPSDPTASAIDRVERTPAAPLTRRAQP